ncbi:MAG: hypothetical protein ABR616_15665 [Dermatophilaceae bacterium]
MAEHCEPCDLPLATCVHGRELPPKEERDTPRIGRLFRARYDGRCQNPDCRDNIYEGEIIQYVDDQVVCGRCS